MLGTNAIEMSDLGCIAGRAIFGMLPSLRVSHLLSEPHDSGRRARTGVFSLWSCEVRATCPAQTRTFQTAGEVYATQTPGGEAAVAVHRGPYNCRMNEARDAFQKLMVANRREFAAHSREDIPLNIRHLIPSSLTLNISSRSVGTRLQPFG